MADDELVDACERYLSRKRCTLWGEAFDVIRPKPRRQAAEWLAEQIAAVQAEIDLPATNGHGPGQNGSQSVVLLPGDVHLPEHAEALLREKYGDDWERIVKESNR